MSSRSPILLSQFFSLSPSVESLQVLTVGPSEFSRPLLCSEASRPLRRCPCCPVGIEPGTAFLGATKGAHLIIQNHWIVHCTSHSPLQQHCAQAPELQSTCRDAITFSATVQLVLSICEEQHVHGVLHLSISMGPRLLAGTVSGLKALLATRSRFQIPKGD